MSRRRPGLAQARCSAVGPVPGEGPGRPPARLNRGAGMPAPDHRPHDQPGSTRTDHPAPGRATHRATVPGRSAHTVELIRRRRAEQRRLHPHDQSDPGRADRSRDTRAVSKLDVAGRSGRFIPRALRAAAPPARPPHPLQQVQRSHEMCDDVDGVRERRSKGADELTRPRRSGRCTRAPSGPPHPRPDPRTRHNKCAGHTRCATTWTGCDRTRRTVPGPDNSTISHGPGPVGRPRRRTGPPPP